MPSSRCRVLFTDSEGILHGVGVDAESFYEAVAIAVASFCEDDVSPSSPGPITEFTVLVYRNPTEHKIRLQQALKCPEHTTKEGPAGITKRQRVSDLRRSTVVVEEVMYFGAERREIPVPDADFPLPIRPTLLELRFTPTSGMGTITPQPSSGPYPFSEFFGRWHAECVKRECALKTVERYHKLGQAAIRLFGDVPLDRLDTLQSAGAFNQLLDRGGRVTSEDPKGRPLAPKTVRHIAFLVQGCLEQLWTGN